MINETRGEVQTELKVVHEDVIQLCSNTTKVLDHLSVCMDILEDTMQSALVMHKLAQLRTHVNVTTD